MEPSPQPSRGEESVGAFVRRRRKERGLTQRDLAELVGVGVRFVSELERNKPSLRTDVVNQVLAAFGMMLGVVERPPEDL